MKDTFTLSMSKDKYDDKNKIDWGKIHYSRIDDLSLENIADIITNGYCFTSIFNKDNFNVFQKTESNWVGSNFVVFDIDNVKNEITLSAFVDSLKYSPTIAYTTPNNGIKKASDQKPYSRFRLLYAFSDTISDKTTYQGIYDIIQSTFNTNYFDTTKRVDNCGRSPIQQYSGNAAKNCQIIKSETIYNIEDFTITKTIEKPIKKEDFKVKIDNEFLQNLNALKPTDFLAYYRDRFQVIYETELTFNEDGFALIPNDYVCIQRNFNIYKEDGQIQTKYHIMKDGEGRRHQLFCNAKIRSQIKPNISIEELIYNLVYDRHYFFDNGDGVLSNQCLLRIAIDAKKATYQMTLKKKPLFKVDKVFCMENQIKPNALKMIVRKKLNFDDISKWYDTTKSIKENLEYSKENHIKVSRATLYNFCNEYGISTKGQKAKEMPNITHKSENTQNHTEHEKATETIKLIGWEKAKEYRNTCQLYQTIYSIKHAI